MLHCQWCSDTLNNKDVVALNRKLFGTDTTDFFCMECLAEYCGCDQQSLLDKIQQFKEEGCTLFG